MSRFRALLFDLDGTLLDTVEDIADSMNAALCRMGFPGHPAKAYLHFVGEGIDQLARRALPGTHRDAATVARCVEEMRREYALERLVKTRPYPGVPGLLDRLAADGYRMAIVSNKPDGSTREIVALKLGKWHFDSVVGARPGVPLKPDPASALDVARGLGIPPENFVYVGDSGIDMATARAAGMYPAGALWGFRGADELVAHGAATLLGKPGDLPALLSSPR
jgi:phosphoglycolate phosphatase